MCGDNQQCATASRSDIGEGKHLTDTLHFSVPTAPPGTEHPEPAGAPPDTVKVEPAPGVKTAGEAFRPPSQMLCTS